MSLTIVFLTFLRSNFPARGDLNWLRRGGGAFGGEEPPSHRFNAGEKIVFWVGVFVLGAVSVGSGLVLDKVLPGLDYLRGDMQVAQMIHGVSAHADHRGLLLAHLPRHDRHARAPTAA